jgi:hypothetical protein
VVLIIVAVVSIFKSDDTGDTISYSEMKSYFESNRVYGYEANINEYTVTLYNTKEAWEAIAEADNPSQDTINHYKELNEFATAILTSEEYYRFFNPHDAYGQSELAMIQETLP